MARINARIQPCLWFDDQAEEAARFYVSVFPNSRLLEQASYTEAGREHHGKPPGSPMVVTFELDGQPFMALNGGPHFRFSEAISLVVHVQDQAELDRYWNALSAGGDPAAQQCGWLKDRFGLSWQVVPTAWLDMATSANRPGVERAMAALMQMKKLDIAALQRAFDGR